MLVIFDTETSSKKGGVAELGSIIIKDSGEVFHFVERCKPHIPIEPDAFAIHGISNEAVEDCRPAKVVIDEWLSSIHDLGEEPIFCAHNLQFDVRMVSYYARMKDYKKFCSLALAKERMPHLPSRALGDLYNLWFDVPLNAHSALDDCKMLQAILPKLLGPTPYSLVPEMQRKEPKLLDKVTFGKHNGKKYTEIPQSYLEYLYRDHDNIDVEYTAGVILGKIQQR